MLLQLLNTPATGVLSANVATVPSGHFQSSVVVSRPIPIQVSTVIRAFAAYWSSDDFIVAMALLASSSGHANLHSECVIGAPLYAKKYLAVLPGIAGIVMGIVMGTVMG